jgi:hypothetical protein
MPRQDPRAEGVPGDDHQERTCGEKVRSADVEADQGGHADQADQEAGRPPPVEAV